MTTPSFKAKKRLDYKAPEFTATDTELEFLLSDEYTKVKQVTRYKRLTEDRSLPLVLDGEDLELNEVRLNGVSIKAEVKGDKLIIENVPDDFELTIENTIAPASNTTLMGLYKSNGVFCTQCEPEGFRRITYFLDRPDVLARYKVTIIAPEYGCPIMLSNGNLVAEGQKDGRRYTVWEDPFPKPSYLFALVAGNFDVLKSTYKTKSGREVSVEVYVDRGAGSRGAYALESIKTAMKFDEEHFGLEYDLDNFKLVAVDFFNQGAMENKSLNIFNSQFVLVDGDSATDTNYYNVESVVGHEYFHNYTGDRVTLRDWFQLSLKESLTVFRDQEFSAHTVSKALTRLKAIEVIRGPQFAEDASPLAHPVRPEEVTEMNNFYTVTIYDKGAEVIRMIDTIIGDETFIKGVQHYLKVNDGKAVTIDDFIQAMHEVSGYDFTQFMRWYTQAGTPKVSASWNVDLEKETLTLKLAQSTAPTLKQEKKEPFVIPVRLSFLNEKGEKVIPQGMPQNSVLLFTKEREDFVFTGVKESLVPVIFEDFSAPVRFEAPYTQDNYALMVSFADDPFIRKNSQVSLVERYLKENLAKATQGEEIVVPDSLIDALKKVCARFNDEEDKLVTAELLALPNLNTMMQMFDNIDIDALDLLHDKLEEEVARALNEEFSKLYEVTRLKGAYRYNVKGYAFRSVGNLCLKMLCINDCAQGHKDLANEKVLKHYQKANNLTEILEAMRLAVHYELPCQDEIVKAFKERFKDDPLVYDNYFRTVGTAPSEKVIFNVRKLMREDQNFALDNPNRVRALVGSLILNNPKALHRKDGSGYLLVEDVVRQLNSLNPMVASKMITPLISFKRYDEKRQALIKESLERLYKLPNLAKDVFEKLKLALS